MIYFDLGNETYMYLCTQKCKNSFNRLSGTTVLWVEDEKVPIVKVSINNLDARALLDHTVQL